MNAYDYNEGDARYLDGLGQPRVLDGLGQPRGLDGLGQPRGLDGLGQPRVLDGLGRGLDGLGQGRGLDGLGQARGLDDSRLLDGRGLDDSRLLDAAETLVTLQTSDLGASNNPLFGSNLSHHEGYPREEDKFNYPPPRDDNEEKLNYQREEDKYAGYQREEVEDKHIYQREDEKLKLEDGMKMNQPYQLMLGGGGILQQQHQQQYIQEHQMGMEGQAGMMHAQGGRGRGKRGPSKRGRKKMGEGRGGGGGGGAGGFGGMGGEPMAGEEAFCEGEPLGEVENAAPRGEQLQVGSLLLSTTILDDILTEKKQELLNHPEIIEFLKQHGMK